MFLNNPFTGAFGLDIGDLAIKLLQIERQWRGFRKPPMFVIKNSRTINLPPGYIVNGELQQPEMVRKKLLQILGKDGRQFKPIFSPWTVVDLPEPKTFLKLIEIESPPSQITDDDVNYHARKHLPYELEETYLDWHIVNNNENAKRSQVLIGAAPKIIADSYTYLLHSVGLLPVSLEIEAISLARAMITADKNYEGEARAILDLGATRSSIIIYDKGSIQFSTTINFSGELITMALMQELKLEYDVAEQLKIKNGLAYDDKYPRYFKAVSNLSDALVEEIKIAINFYKERFVDTNPITHITMCGGVAQFKNIDNFLSRKLKISAHPGHPWKNFFNPNFTEADNLGALGMTSAIGLALRAAKPLTE